MHQIMIPQCSFSQLIEDNLELGVNKLIVGDFNTVLNTTLDRKGSKHNNEKSATLLKEIMSELEMVDVWRNRNQGVKRYSYCRKKPYLNSSQIDYTIASRSIEHFIRTICYIPGIMTDHSAVYMSLQVHNIDRGSGYWKFNDSHLKKEEFLNEMNQLIDLKLKEYHSVEPQQAWECLKLDIASLSQDWSKKYV